MFRKKMVVLKPNNSTRKLAFVVISKYCLSLVVISIPWLKNKFLRIFFRKEHSNAIQMDLVRLISFESVKDGRQRSDVHACRYCRSSISETERKTQCDTEF